MSTTVLPASITERTPLSPPLRALRTRLRSFSAGPELLYDLMGFGPFVEMAMTRDGVLIARPRRSLAFDAFVGKPPASALERTALLWRELTASERDLVLARLGLLHIAPERIGIPDVLACRSFSANGGAHGR